MFAQLKDKVVFGAAHLWYRNKMAEVAERVGHSQFEARVTAVSDLNSVMRRITLSAPEFSRYSLVGPDEYFGLLMPGADGALHMPDAERRDVRAAITDMPESEQPDLRWYTVRRLRVQQGEIDVDIVTHGESGPGSAWATTAEVGDRVGFRSGGALYTSFDAPRQLLVADETAVPALLAILEERDRRGLPGLGDGVVAHVEAPSSGVLAGTGLPAGISVHERGDAAPGARVLAALAEDADAARDLDYAWVCGESGLATSLRRHLVKNVGVDKKAVTFSGYWKLGAARG